MVRCALPTAFPPRPLPTFLLSPARRTASTSIRYTGARIPRREAQLSIQCARGVLHRPLQARRRAGGASRGTSFVLAPGRASLARPADSVDVRLSTATAALLVNPQLGYRQGQRSPTWRLSHKGGPFKTGRLRALRIPPWGLVGVIADHVEPVQLQARVVSIASLLHTVVDDVGKKPQKHIRLRRR